MVRGGSLPGPGAQSPMSDWRAWHRAYDDSESSLSRRLRVVRARVDALVTVGGVRSVLSLCAGDGRDVIPVLARLDAAVDPRLVLVERDDALAAAAERRARDMDVDVTVIRGDAGSSQTWRDETPVDLLMLCGIFGNIGDDDIQATICAVPALLNAGGCVIWTRGAFQDRDLRPQVRAWFERAALAEVTFDGEPAGYGVGVNRRTPDAVATPVPDRLFTFIR